MHRIVSTEDWLDARRELLEEEKSFQKARDALAEKRRELPWREVPDYEFQTEDGVRRLSELFDNCSQLMIYHFMYGPEWDAGCPSCSFWADSYDRTVPHLKARDVSLIAVSRAPLEKLLAYRERMGWTFPWVSSANSDFNFDFGVSFSREQIEAGSASYNYRPMQGKMEELPGLSAFKRQDGAASRS